MNEAALLQLQQQFCWQHQAQGTTSDFCSDISWCWNLVNTIILVVKHRDVCSFAFSTPGQRACVAAANMACMWELLTLQLLGARCSTRWHSRHSPLKQCFSEIKEHHSKNTYDANICQYHETASNCSEGCTWSEGSRGKQCWSQLSAFTAWWCWWLDSVWISGTDEDQKKILKGLNLTIREGEAWKKKPEDVDSDDLL